MKKIILILLLLPFLSRSQENTPLTILPEARDCEFIGSFSGEGDLFQDLDSLLKNKFRPGSSAPSGTTLVTLAGITAGVWLEVDKRLRRDPAAHVGNNNPLSRMETILRATANAWLIAALDADIAYFDANEGYSDKRARGRKRLKKE